MLSWIYKGLGLKHLLIFSAIGLYGLFVFFDPTKSWIEISKVFYPGEGLGPSYKPLEHFHVTIQIIAAYLVQYLLTVFLGYALLHKYWSQIQSYLIFKILLKAIRISESVTPAFLKSLTVLVSTCSTHLLRSTVLLLTASG